MSTEDNKAQVRRLTEEVLSESSRSPLHARERKNPLKGAKEPMSELDDFLTTTLARQVEAEEALHNGDPAPRMQMWSR